MPTDYQGNPNKKDKENEATPLKMEKVVTEAVIEKKKSIGRRFKDVFLGGDFKSAARYVLAEVALPALRNMLVDTSQKAIERVVYGESMSSRRRGSPEYRSFVQYNNPVGNRGLSYTHLPDQPRYYPPSQQARPRSDRTQLVIVSRSEAEKVVETLIDAVDKYGSVSVANLNDLVGLTSSHVDHKWGWTRLNSVEIRQLRDGYLIDLPDPEPI